jgi:PAS domain S-box-containing protein
MNSTLFSIPHKEKNFQGFMVYALVLTWSVVSGIIVSTGFYTFPDLWRRWFTFLCISSFMAVVNLALNNRGYTRQAAWSFSIMLWLYITVPCYSAGGIMAPGILMQTNVILTAAFLLGWRNGLYIGILTMGTDFWLAYIQSNGYLPVPTITHNPITRWISSIIPFGTILALQYYATSHLRAGLIAMQNEMIKREKVEHEKDQTLYALGERIKELKTLYSVGRILQEDDTPYEQLFKRIADVLPPGWQYPDITAASVSVAGTHYTTDNYRKPVHSQQAATTTAKGTTIVIEVVYLKTMPQLDEGPFLKEERSLINMLAEMLKTHLEQRERHVELRDYKYAIDLASIVSISGADGRFSFVNDNFCKVSKYTADELIGADHSILWSGLHAPEYFDALTIAMQDGKPYHGEFCNKAKDGTFYWTETTIVPFLNEKGAVYQYLSINHDITERKIADDKIKESEQLLKRITSQIPGNTYMFEIDENGHLKALFMNRGTDVYNHTYDIHDITAHPEKLREMVHNDDISRFNDTMKEAYLTQSPVSCQYRIIVNNEVRWRWMQAVPEKDKNGKMIWYGATSDITPLVDHIAFVEQILWDVSHVIRRPVASMLGITQLIRDHDMSAEELKDLSKKLHIISEEMDKYIREITLAYNQKKHNANFNIDTRSLIDSRHSMFR